MAMQNKNPRFDWAGLEARLSDAINDLAVAVQRQLPKIQWNLLRSKNDLKPLDLVATFAFPGQEDDQLVLSVMFTLFRGTLEVHCDVMRENGPILSEIPTRDLGSDPTNDAIEKAADEVEVFVLNAMEVIVQALGR